MVFGYFTAAGMAALTVYLVMQIVWHLRMSEVYATPPAPPGPLPKTAVSLTLRGADPFLHHCLEGLLNQDHPDYQVVIMIDSRVDGSVEMVERLTRNVDPRKVVVRYVDSPRMTCSLRMEALIQVVEGLDESFAALVLCDADVVPHRSWLSEMTAPLRDPSVGVATGIRWYSPVDGWWGTTVRYIWNAAAIPQMIYYQMGFGGSLAIRRKALEETGLLERWSRILFEDQATVCHLLRSGWKLSTVGSATMVNRESIGFTGNVVFITRQLLNARLYHFNWKKILRAALCISTGIGCVTVGLGGALLTRNFPIAILAGATLVLFSGTQLTFLVLMEQMIRRTRRERGEPEEPVPGKILRGALLTQGLYLYCLVKSLRTWHVVWRGLAYDIQQPDSVRLVEYQPWLQKAEKVSL